MKMDKKLTLLFSLLAVVMTLCNSIYAYNYNMTLLNENTRETLLALGKNMLTEVEQNVEMMDYAIDELYTNVQFMNAMFEVSREEDSWNLTDQVSMQTLMSHFLYQEPLLSKFYRVSVYSPNGFYLSNHFEKTDTVVSLSDEAKEIIEQLLYLESVNERPFARKIVGPHADPWSSRKTDVFSAVKAVHWHGVFIGNIEVSSTLDTLNDIFLVEEMEGLTAYAHFSDGTFLYRARDDAAVYEGMPESGVTRYHMQDGSERFVLRLHSKTLDLDLFIAQDIRAYHVRSRQLLFQHLGVSGVILLTGIVFITLISKRLTRSIRGLTKKISRLPSEHLLHPDDAQAQYPATNPRDREIYQLEQVFNELLLRLRESTQNEMALQQSSLQARLNTLQTQINPHFVYNTLNIISAKGLESGSEEIIEICDRFAQMLRYSTDLRSHTATLEEELINARHYLMLAKARYEDKLEFSIIVSPDASGLLIPKLTLQPLMENALTHGFSGTERREIKLTGTLADDTLELTIRDNGDGFSQEILGNH